MKNKIFNKKINKLGIGLLSAAALLSLVQVSSPFAMNRENQVVINQEGNVAEICEEYVDVDNIKYKLNHENNTATVVECLNKKIDKIEICDLVEDTYKVTEIQEEVFNGCKNLEKVVIGKYVEYIGAKAFVGVGGKCIIMLKCSGEKEIKFEENAFGTAKIRCANKYYAFKKEGNTIKFFQKFIGKNGIKYGLDHENKTATVCSRLNEEVTTVTLENEIAVRYKNEDINYKVEQIGRGAFDGCKNLKKVVIGKYVTKIGAGAFCEADRNCNIVFDGQCEREINLGQDNDMYGDEIFGDAKCSCSDDNYEVVIDKEKHIAKIYKKCYVINNIKYILDHENKTATVVECLSKKEKQIEICDLVEDEDTYKVTEIQEEAFNGCKNLEKVVIGKYVEYIGAKAFVGVGKKCIIILKYSDEQEIEFEKDAFGTAKIRCENDYYEPKKEGNTIKCFQKFIDENGIKYRLYHEKKTATVVECLKKEATTVILENKIAVRYENKDIRYTVERIGKGAFNNCKNLKKVVIGEYVKRIGDGAFWDADRNCNIVFDGQCERVINLESEEVFYDAVFSCSDDNYEVMVNEEECIAKIYKEYSIVGNIKYRLNHENNTATVVECLNKKANQIEICDLVENTYKVTEIGQKVFNNCRNLKKVVIGEYVKCIGDGAFGDADSKCNIVFGGQCEREINLESDKIFGDAVFSCYCDKYEVTKTDDKIIICQKYFKTKDMEYELNYKDRTAKATKCINDSIESLDLTKVTDKQGKVFNVIEVDDKACINCKNLNNVEFGNSIKKIGKKAFRNVPKGCKIIFKIENETEIQLGNGALGKSVVVCSDGENFNINVKKGGILVKKAVKETETIGGLKYELNIAEKRATVTECINKEVSSIEIPESIYVKGHRIYCEVNAIADKAFHGCTKLDIIIVGKNINTIGKDILAKTERPGMEITRGVGSKMKMNRRLFGKIIVESKDILAKTERPGMEITHGVLALRHGVGSEIKIDKKLMEDMRIISCNDNKKHKSLGIKFYETNGGCYVEVYQRFAKDENFKYELKCDEDGAGTAKIVQCKNKDLTEVVIPDCIRVGLIKYDLTEIGEEAFCECEELEKVVIGRNIEIIRDSAFLGCKRLNDVTIGKKVNEIEEKAFGNIKNCDVLLQHDFKEEIKLGWDAFDETTAFRTSDSDIDFKIDESHDDKYQKQIVVYRVYLRDKCFKYELDHEKKEAKLVDALDGFVMKKPSECTIPATIGFKYKDEYIEYCVTEIASEVFAGFDNLTKVIIDNGGIEKVEAGALKLGENAFGNAKVYCEDTNYAPSIENNQLRFYNRYCEVGTIEYELDYMNKTAKVNKCLDEKVEFQYIPEKEMIGGVGFKITEINDEAFAGCSFLRNLTIEDRITRIGANAFEGTNICITFSKGCEQDIALGNNALNGASIECLDNAYGVATQAKNMIKIRKISLWIENFLCRLDYTKKTARLEGVKDTETINITTVNFNGEDWPITEIGYDVLSGAPGLKEVVIGNNVNSIEYTAFARAGSDCKIILDWSNGKTARIPGLHVFGDAKVSCRNDNYTLVIKDNIAKIYVKYCIIGRTFKCELDYINDTAKIIECLNSEVETIEVTSIATRVGRFNITEVNDRVFANCKRLKTVTIGSAVTRIGADAFAGANNRCEVIFDKSVERDIELGDNALGKAKSRCKLNRYGVIIENNIAKIRLKNWIGETFKCEIDYTNDPNGTARVIDCLDDNVEILCLSNVYFLDEKKVIPITEVNDGAFASCKRLKTVKIGSAVTRIGADAFAGANNECEVIFSYLGGEIGLGNNALGRAKHRCELEDYEVIIKNSIAKIYSKYSRGRIFGYELDNINNTVKIIECLNSEIETIELTNIVLDGRDKFNITEVNDGVFANCKRLKTVKIGSAVTRIGADAFAGANNRCEVIFDGPVGQEIKLGKNALGKAKRRCKLDNCEVIIKNSIAKICGEYYEKEDIKYELDHVNQTAKVFEYLGSEDGVFVNILDFVEFENKEYRVTEMEDSAWKGYSNLWLTGGKNIEQINDEIIKDGRVEAMLIDRESGKVKIGKDIRKMFEFGMIDSDKGVTIELIESEGENYLEFIKKK